MESITKAKLTHEQIAEMVKRAFGKEAIPETIKELTDGWFNSAYMIQLASGIRTVLKVSPSSDVRIMRYEKGIMETEVQVMKKVASLKTVPVPSILYYDQKKDLVDSEFFFMEYIEGLPLNKVRGELTAEQHTSICADTGRFAKQMSNAGGGYFGNISQKDKRFDTWGEAFSSMIKELLADALVVEVALPCSHQEIMDIVKKNRDILDMVKIPSLVHKDLWEGNIFVDPQTAKITGFVDFERAIQGDALLEPVCGFLLDNVEFMNNYLGKISLDREELIRTALYRLYLFLLMVIECPFRQYPGEDIDKWPREQLDKVLAELQ